MRARGEAFRVMADLTSDPNTNVSKNPADFTLFELGTYDDSNARFDLHQFAVLKTDLLSLFVLCKNHNSLHIA